MTRKVRKIEKGEQEIRILPDGRIVFVAPDEAMLSVAQEMERQRLEQTETREDLPHGSE